MSETEHKGIKYTVRKTRGKTWAVDKLFCFGGGYYIKENTRYFKTQDEALKYKKKNTEGQTLTLVLDCFGAMNTDLAHWLMASIEMWNKKMKTSPIKCTHFETEGMKKPVMDWQDLKEFYDEWKERLKYDWGN